MEAAALYLTSLLNPAALQAAALYAAACNSLPVLLRSTAI